jgi:GTPase Era involved in 16S rRNA processing
VTKVLLALESFACRREAANLASYIKEAGEKLSQDVFNLVVLGEFKRGKTTFINALLGAELLPAAVVPLTSIVTLVRYGERIKAEVVYLNNDKIQVSLADVAGYVTEEGNPGNDKKVKLVQLEYPSDYLKEGVVLIDTPGVGSVYQNNTDETYRFLPKVDAAIFLLSSDQPLSHSECGFLSEIKRYSVKTFFVLNKIDYLEHRDRLEALKFAEKALKDKTGFADVNIIPLSAKTALEARIKNDSQKLAESNLPEFTKVLEASLLAEKGSVVLTVACTRGISAIDELMVGLQLEFKALAIPLEELQNKIGLFNQMVENLSRDQEDNKYIFQGEMKKVYRVLETEITAFQEDQNNKLEKEIDILFKENKNLPGRQILKLLETHIESAIMSAFERWKPEIEEKVKEAYRKVVARFTDKTNKAVEELLEQSAQIFKIDICGFTKMEVLTDESRLYFVFGDEQSMLLPDPVKLGAFFLPGLLAGPKILKEMKKKIERDLDRNCGRLRTDYSDRIYESARCFQKDFMGKYASAVEGTAVSLNRAVIKREKSEMEVNEYMVKLNEQKDLLGNVRQRLKEVLEKVK